MSNSAPCFEFPMVNLELSYFSKFMLVINYPTFICSQEKKEPNSICLEVEKQKLGNCVLHFHTCIKII